VNFFPDVQREYAAPAFPMKPGRSFSRERRRRPFLFGSVAWWVAHVGAADQPTVVCVIRRAAGGWALCVKPTSYKRHGPDDQRAHWTKPFRLPVSVFVQPASDEAIDAVKAAHGDPLIHHGENP
jgi:hypothetical protein